MWDPDRECTPLVLYARGHEHRVDVHLDVLSDIQLQQISVSERLIFFRMGSEQELGQIDTSNDPNTKERKQKGKERRGEEIKGTDLLVVPMPAVHWAQSPAPVSSERCVTFAQRERFADVFVRENTYCCHRPACL